MCISWQNISAAGSTQSHPNPDLHSQGWCHDMPGLACQGPAVAQLTKFHRLKHAFSVTNRPWLFCNYSRSNVALMLVHCRLDPCGVTLIVLRVLVVLTNQHWTEHVHLTHVSHKKLCKLVLTFIFMAVWKSELQSPPLENQESVWICMPLMSLCFHVRQPFRCSEYCQYKSLNIRP